MNQAEINRKKISDAYDARVASEEDALLSICAPDVVLWQAESLPYGGTYSGLDHFRYGLARLAAAWRDRRYRVEEITAGGDLVLVYQQAFFTGHGGKTYGFPIIDVWRFREGQAVELRPFYWDTRRLLQAYEPRSAERNSEPQSA